MRGVAPALRPKSRMLLPRLMTARILSPHSRPNSAKISVRRWRKTPLLDSRRPVPTSHLPRMRPVDSTSMHLSVALRSAFAHSRLVQAHLSRERHEVPLDSRQVQHARAPCGRRRVQHARAPCDRREATCDRHQAPCDRRQAPCENHQVLRDLLLRRRLLKVQMPRRWRGHSEIPGLVETRK